MRLNNYEYDVFISHAVEDKIPIANELCVRLEQAGLRVWYSGKELGIGDSIEKAIENGLHRSRYGIVILSPTYLAKNWTIREFYTLLAREIENRKVILPVLFNVTPDDLKNKDLLMADRFAVNADRGIDHVVDRLLAEIRKPAVRRPRMSWLSGVWAVLAFSLLSNVLNLYRDLRPSDLEIVAQQRVVPAGFASLTQAVKEEGRGCPEHGWQKATFANQPAVDRPDGSVTVAVTLHLSAPEDASRVGEIVSALASAAAGGREGALTVGATSHKVH